MSSPPDTFRTWGRIYLGIGLGGLLLFYSSGLFPSGQAMISRTEAGVFFTLNQMLGLNPVWDWTVLITASDFWAKSCYVAAAIVFTIRAWKNSELDYGRTFGYLAFMAIVVFLTEQTADFVADNLDRVLPWKSGVIERIKADYDADFFEMYQHEGIVDDTASALFCLNFMMLVRSPKTTAVSFGMLAAYVFSSILVGSQWLTIQIASAFVGATAAGVALTYGGRGIEHCEREISKLFVASVGRLMLGRRFFGSTEAGRTGEFRRKMLEPARAVSAQGTEQFWTGVVMPQAVRLLNADPDTAVLYPSPKMTTDRQKSSRRVRFLRTGDGATYVIRAEKRTGGVFPKSPSFSRFMDSVKNNVYLEQMGLPVARVVWAREGIDRMGTRSYFFAIEEHLDCRPLDGRSRDELRAAMALLARMHGRTLAQWGGLHDGKRRNRVEYVLEFLRGNFMYWLRRTERQYGAGPTPGNADRIWKSLEREAIRVLEDERTAFRLIHGDVSPRNLLVDRNGSIRMVDLLTVRGDLPGWEIVKACVSMTRDCPENCPAAWEAYFEAAGEERWEAFRVESRLGFAVFALRELAHRRIGLGKLPPESEKARSRIEGWIDGLLGPPCVAWGDSPGETDWKGVFDYLGIHGIDTDSHGAPKGAEKNRRAKD
jgi:hypothetical protein